MTAGVHDWDAASYQRISVPHEQWAAAILERLPLRGDETVLDAGCGTGRVTRMLVERLPEGKVIAVDGSAAMLEKVREVLRPTDEALACDLTELMLSEPVDAVVSSAVFHWIPDHDLLFRRLRAALRKGGRLAAQCGGAGNIHEFRVLTARIAAREPYANAFEGFVEPWFYAGPAETEERLRAVGFEQVRCWLQPRETVPPDAEAFMRTLILKPQLEHLPERLAERYLADVLEATGEPLRLRYVRLNIEAVAGQTARPSIPDRQCIESGR
ncbi:MAG: methyltransferase domain-containing protein [Solirubrobacterales bacterium]